MTHRPAPVHGPEFGNADLKDPLRHSNAGKEVVLGGRKGSGSAHPSHGPSRTSKCLRWFGKRAMIWPQV